MTVHQTSKSLFVGIILIWMMLSSTFASSDYVRRVERISAIRDSFSIKYASQQEPERIKTRLKASIWVRKVFSEQLLPAWIGTQWDFNGTTQTPREGSIACGYFISTLLRDLGFQVERSRMAQQASLLIIKSLTGPQGYKDWSYLTPQAFQDKVKALPEGLYVLGLDIHTGFVLHEHDQVSFIHSSYIKPMQVTKESASNSKAIAASKRFVIGRVDNDWLMGKWLRKEKVETVVAG